MRNPFEVMPAATAEIFTLLGENALLDRFVLIGGTALALHIGHRMSEDLDFITTLPKLPGPALSQTRASLSGLGHSVKFIDEPAKVFDFENAGMNLHDYRQNWLVDGEVKVTFFTGDEQHKRSLLEQANLKHFRIASFEELCKLKALVASSRSKSRDWVDLFILERDHGFGLAQWKNAYDAAGLSDTHFETALNRISGGTLPKDDEGFSALMANPPSVDDIVTRFRALRRDYEVACAKAALGDSERR